MGIINKSILIKYFRHGNDQQEYFDKKKIQKWEQSTGMFDKIFQK